MKLLSRLFVLLIFVVSAVYLAACNGSPVQPSPNVGVLLDPRGDVFMKLGEEKIFTATAYGMTSGDRYSWTLYIPNTMVDKYCRMEILEENIVKITALKITNNPCGLRVYVSRDGVSYGKRTEHLANINISF
ncbi:MAG: hypothetical protein A3B91_03060 [Candidatus Yanofskybacteria bacterium RIFCSPHIGHO2_02_FULL_41_29]|uniref:Uncharacterized protein n=1 Tax=Candidatus Yanofskybacteria bacterium RIFCSPHIGHO2_01_FULL_41_53 TaxID=1802663 RepID=A0A1F8EG91_9BACT|nr:MAG: hypothetical protein A2650_00220 [Candidatus Yanofskybacteria bacterium RIFCSPHIGHO2_01_FULL_41_53]OGN11125.1 MAG: hypothetical protein A3B91_03060 [Candidatus Yanofskybacteria bacterium RIFCSPHIGHO2_02_FULL_41_29]OGN16991.1 MAG: hypothetical protein A3F48_00400 [Candidatus Yanofskybacteria bacterium RIFCSPHIGHO2_12_FULL_41_9]OGN22051.1 MAG: hypothetical protein A2916_00290 [Candidatus Yanofskybacteria bacterium RIFCSPLOWO2_01_FULL_41_67]OGN29336.1 MAG: hypothetical protein A3H54_03175 